MTLRTKIGLLLAAPVAILFALALLGLTIPVPHLGRDYVLRFLLPISEAATDLPTVYGPQDNSRPLVVIDAGHGGRDPGAVGQGIREKDLTLALAKALRDRLVREGGVRVALTRDGDDYVTLGERPEIARRMNAALFLSIHADSAGEARGEVNGASIYTLSTKASSEAAARFAARENDADRVNGVKIEGQSEGVSSILIELSQRRSQQEASEFAGLIAREGKSTLRFHPQARRSAALAVLRAPDVPSVLYESGFVTNAEEAARLTSAEGQQQFADAMTRAIRIFLARNSGA